MKKNQIEIPIWEKYILTVPEACALSGLGRDKVYSLAREYQTKFVIKNGTKTLIKRKEFEDFLSKAVNI